MTWAAHSRVASDAIEVLFPMGLVPMARLVGWRRRGAPRWHTYCVSVEQMRRIVSRLVRRVGVARALHLLTFTRGMEKGVALLFVFACE